MGKTVGAGKKDLGGQIDNFSVTLFLHTGKDRSGRQKCTFYIDSHHQIPFGRVDFIKRLAAYSVIDGGIVDQNINPAKSLEGFLGHGQRICFSGNVGLKEGGLPAEIFYLSDRLLEIVHVLAGDNHDPGALGSHFDSKRPAQPLGTAGHDGDFIFQTHCSLLSTCY